MLLAAFELIEDTGHDEADRQGDDREE